MSTQKTTRNLMTELTKLEELSTKIVTNQNLQAILSEKTSEITRQVRQDLDGDIEKLAVAVNEITSKLNALA